MRTAFRNEQQARQTERLHPFDDRRMRKRALLTGAFLILTVTVLAVQDASAQWAAHGIIDAGNPRTTYPVALALSENKTKVRVFIPVKNGEDQSNRKGYFVIQANKRLPRSELEFRVSMERWKRYQEMLKKGRDYRWMGGERQRSGFHSLRDNPPPLSILPACKS